MSELTIIIKDEEKTLKKKFLLYVSYYVSQTEPIIQECIQETLRNFDGVPTNVIVNIKMIIE